MAFTKDNEKNEIRDERKERISYAQGHGIISRGCILHERTGEISRTSNTWPFVEKKKKRRNKKTRDGKNGERDANIFASRRSQRGESVQKVSQRQVITYTTSCVYVITCEFKVEVNYLVGI